MARSPAPAARLLTLLALLVGGACDDPFAGSERPPEIDLAPGPGDQPVTADSLVVSGTARGDRRVERVSFRLNGGDGEAVAIQPARSVEFRFVVRGLAVGENRLELRAEDAGGRTAAETLTFSTRDGEPPRVALQLPRSGELLGRDSARVVLAANDQWGLASASYAVDGGPEQALPAVSGRSAELAFTVRGLAAGEHAVRVTVRDLGGNADSATVRFTSAAAELRVTSPRPDSTVGALVATLMGDIESSVPVARLAYSVDGGPPVRPAPLSTLHRVGATADGGTRYTFILPADSLPQGTAAVRVLAEGAEGQPLGAVTASVRVSVPTRRYTVRALGGLGVDTRGAEVNEAGQVAGWYVTGSGEQRAFAWDGAQMIDLAPHLGGSSAAAAINDDGVVVGTFQAGCPRSFRYRLGDAAPAPLPTGCHFHAVDVNSGGKVALWEPLDHAEPNSFLARVHLLDTAGGLHLLHSRAHRARRINDRDEVLAWFPDGFFNFSGYILRQGAEPALAEYCLPGDLNDRGEVANGSSCKSFMTGSRVAGKDVRNVGYRVWVGTLNDRREGAGLVDYARRPGEDEPRRRPVFWDGSTTHLVEVDGDWIVDEVSDLNDAGVILAHGRNTRTGARGALLLIPVP